MTASAPTTASSGNRFDLIVIGGGPAGYVAAIRAAQLGMKVCCIEKRKALGGTCLNIGCIPSKALLDSSEHYAHAKHKLSRHGVTVSDVKLNLDVMMQRKEAVVRSLTQGVAGLFKKNKIEWALGHGKILATKPDGFEVEVSSDGVARTLSCAKVLLATGSDVIQIPVALFDGKRIVSSTEALSFTEVPKHLLVVGGGVIGLEMGSVWLRLGAKVTVVEALDRILPSMDKQLSLESQKIFAKQGFDFKLSTKLISAKNAGSHVDVELESAAGKENLKPDYVLVAVGRRPFTDGLGLESIGVKLDKAKRVEIDEHFQTNVPGVYAIGDIVRGPMLAHKAEDEGIAAAEIMAGQHGHVNYQAIPGVVYTWPEVASVGFTEEECQAKEIKYNVGKFPFIANGRAKAMDEVDGFVKILSDAKTDRVLGVHIVGPRASDMIAEAAIVIEFGGAAEDIARSSHAHPTLAEVMKEAALSVGQRAIHF